MASDWFWPTVADQEPRHSGVFWCAWHDAQAAVPGESLEHDGPPLPDGRTTPTRQGHYQKVGCLKEA